MDCGPTCLRMVARHYGKHTSIQVLRDRSNIGKEGVNLLGISEAAESLGFRSRSVKIDYHTLTKDAPLPAIIHWNQNHFIVLYKAKKDMLFVADPAAGLAQYSSREFKSCWISNKENGQEEGVALLLEPAPAFFENNNDAEETPKTSLAFRNIFNYLRPYKKLILQLFIGLGISSLLQLILPFLTQSIVDVGVNTANIHFIYIVLLAQIALFSGRLVIDFVRSWILLHISTRINISILTDFLIKLMKLPVSFFDSKKTGDIMQRMNDHSRIESFLTGPSINILFSLCNLILFSFVLAFFNPYIFTVFILSSVLYTAWVILFLKSRKILDNKRFAVSSKEQSATIQLIQGMQEIKLNGVEKPMRWSWERLQARKFLLSMKSLSLNQWQQAGVFFINEGKNIVITFLSAKAVIDGQMTLGSMLAVQYIIGQLNSPVEQMITFVQSWQNAKISMERLNEVHAMEDEEPAHLELLKELPLSFKRQLAGGKSDQSMPVTKTGETFQQQTTGYLPGISYPLINEPLPGTHIKLENITFTYTGAGNEPVLRDINLQIPKGKTTAIVGISGSGKTTLLKLLLKFYEPQKGTIKLDNTPLQNISHQAWRNHCGVVMQESFIFSDTIARNIAVGGEKIDMDRLNLAITIANIREFIETLPLGLNTMIGAEGTGISMGQKQRLLIARAVYRDPEFIFLDEATNSLDANNESTIIHNLQSFLQGKTVVVVAHRLSTVKHADQIVVLNNGAITEKGLHQELINLKGEYYTLVKNQLELGN